MATYPSQTWSFEDRLSTHLQEIERRLNSQKWPRSPILEVLQQNAKPYEGGEYITEIVEDNYTPNGDAIGEGSTISAVQPNVMISAHFQPRMTAEGIFLDGFRRDKIMTQGSMGPVLNWVEELLNNRMNAIRENAALHICAATTGTAADGSTRIQSLFDIVKSSGTVGNLSATTYTYWASQVDSTSAAWSAGGPSRFRTLLRKTRRYQGFAGPDVLFASGTTIDAMKATNFSKTTFFRAPDTRDEKVGEMGDGRWTWTAKAPFDPDGMIDNLPVYYDPHLDALESSAISTGGVLVGINTKAVYLREAPGIRFRVDPWRPSEQRYGSFTKAMYLAELVTCNRGCNLLMTNIS